MIVQGPESEIARLFREVHRQLERIELGQPEWKIVKELERANELLTRIGLYFPPPPPTPTSITFEEITMNATAAGNSQVFTGTLAPAGSAFPPGTTFGVTSNDTAVSPSVDSTGLIVSVTYPSGWVESTTTPLAFEYTATSVSPALSLTATITPSAPPAPLPTGITFAQTT